MYQEFKIEKSKDEEGQPSQFGKEDESDQKDPITSLLTPPETSKPLLKLNVKFELPMYNEEVDFEKLDDWIRQIEVYCSMQQITEDEVNTRIALLHLVRATLI